jgi:hypothetical protein
MLETIVKIDAIKPRQPATTLKPGQKRSKPDKHIFGFFNYSSKLNELSEIKQKI